MTSEILHSFPICSLCGEGSEKVVIQNVIKNSKKYNIFECLSCKVWITHPKPSLEELSTLYSTGNYRAKTGKRFNPVLEKIIHFLTLRKGGRIKKYVEGGRVLDIGCGRGLFLNLMKKDGWLVTGQEYDQKSAAYAINNYGVEVHTGGLEGKFESESFDVVNINHVLEHMEKPGETLSECHRILKKGGLLVVAVPNIDSFQAKFGMKNWFQLDIPYHLYHFSSKSLIDLIEKKCFKVDLVRHFKFEYNPFGWLQSMLNASGIQENLLYEQLKSSELKNIHHKTFPVGSYLKSFFLIPLYLPLSFLFSIIEAVFKKGGTIEIYSLKN
ncbi:MAG: class I SAM-dependent methyltransferase [Nitrospinae bacterium]|nr:class I SAM-dependent methyltransferase [Nitrospinota bacterium]